MQSKQAASPDPVCSVFRILCGRGAVRVCCLVVGLERSAECVELHARQGQDQCVACIILDLSA
jgi:hypothetical protein